jgi:large subunit ribosomal protein L13
MIMNTVHAKKNEVERRWLLVDAKGLVLGRVATEVASILRGKRKASYTPHIDTGDFVVVVNAGEVRLSGKKWSDKVYYDHSGWVGGLKERTAREVMAKHPTEMVRRAVKGMLPKGPLGYQMIRKLKVYAGAEHPHVAQKPEAIKIDA